MLDHKRKIEEVISTDTNHPTKPLPPLEPRQTGTVKWFDPKKGFGFILRDGDKDVFFHSTDAKKSGLDDDLEEGERVSFALAPTPRGFKAVSLKREH